MDYHKARALLDQYFEGETTLAEEQELRDYFAAGEVADDFQQYAPLFRFAARERELVVGPVQLPKEENSGNRWLAIAASVVVLIGVGIAVFQHTRQNELGTYEDPEVAFRETQKALALLSTQVNKGVESVEYLKEYEETKKTIFKN